MTVRELGHVVLYVRDVARSAEFYATSWAGTRSCRGPAHSPAGRRVLIGPHPPRAAADRRGADATAIPAGRRVGMYHFGVNVGESDDDLRAMLGRLRQANAKVVGASDHTVTHSLYVEDPDGNEVELYIDVPGGLAFGPFSHRGAPRPLNL